MKKFTLISQCWIFLCLGNLHAQQSIDAYVLSPGQNTFVQIASASNSLSSPVDVDFYPSKSVRPFELWILNQGTYNSGGSTVTVSNANQNTRTFKYVMDGNAWHFMAMASALAFGDSTWATSADILDANRNGGRYTGPTLWPGDMSIYGVVGNPTSPGVNGSHLDMVHQSPYSKGIAFEKDLVYWVLDGYEGNIKRYDFVGPHQPGGEDHSAAKVQVYPDFTFTKHSTLPSHIVIDANKKYLYGCDPVGKRIFRIDITTGTQNGTRVKVNNEPLSGYYSYSGLVTKDIITSGVASPVGIDVYGDRLIVTDNATSEIIIYNIADDYKEVGRIKVNYATTPNLMGIKVGPDGKLYFADKANKLVYMIENNSVLPLAVNETQNVDDLATVYPNPAATELVVQLKNQPKNTEMLIMNMLGEIVLRSNISNISTTVDLSALKNGIYLLQVKSNNQVLTQKILKQ